jgi:hypothetical protein
MRDLGRRLLIGLAAVAVVVMVVGYAFIFRGIATPVRGDLGTLDLPPDGEAVAAVLDDGRPVWVVAGARGDWVLEARAPRSAGAPGALVAWCSRERIFVDAMGEAVYAADGTLLDGPLANGMVAFAIRPGGDDATRVVVGSESAARPVAEPSAQRPAPCDPAEWTAHEPAAGEVFDPSVAADQEPPGWIWLEGTLRAVEGRARLCDGTAPVCDGSAAAEGIDPATIPPDGIEGRFIGLVRDGAIEGLAIVPRND